MVGVSTPDPPGPGTPPGANHHSGGEESSEPPFPPPSRGHPRPSGAPSVARSRHHLLVAGLPTLTQAQRPRDRTGLDGPGELLAGRGGGGGGRTGRGRTDLPGRPCSSSLRGCAGRTAKRSAITAAPRTRRADTAPGFLLGHFLARDGEGWEGAGRGPGRASGCSATAGSAGPRRGGAGAPPPREPPQHRRPPPRSHLASPPPPPAAL